jgi:uncharacterized protein (UPF0276 family)
MQKERRQAGNPRQLAAQDRAVKHRARQPVSKNMISLPHLGHGVGLRPRHFADVLAGKARADWFEVISENFMIAGGQPLRVLDRARGIAPIVMHGVSLDIGGGDPLNLGYLRALEFLIDRFEPAWISDHLCWGVYKGHYTHDLLPIPFTEEAVAHVAGRIRRVQDRLRRRILIENISSYITYRHSSMTEWEFVSAVANMADCAILLDINNLYVNAMNQGFDPDEYIAGVPVGRVAQIHLAGHSRYGRLLIDTHDHPISPAVWRLYARAVGMFGPVATLVEWDDRIPPLSALIAQAERAREIELEVTNGRAGLA